MIPEADDVSGIFLSIIGIVEVWVSPDTVAQIIVESFRRQKESPWRKAQALIWVFQLENFHLFPTAPVFPDRLSV